MKKKTASQVHFNTDTRYILAMIIANNMAQFSARNTTASHDVSQPKKGNKNGQNKKLPKLLHSLQ